MSTPTGTRKRAAPVQGPATLSGEDAPRIWRAPLAQRLPGMSDERLLSVQRAAMRISADPEHSRRRSAARALPLIDAEIGRRAAALADTGPTSGLKEDTNG